MTVLHAHTENGMLVLDETLPDELRNAKLILMVRPLDSDTAYQEAALETAFRSDEDWGDTLDHLVEKD